MLAVLSGALFLFKKYKNHKNDEKFSQNIPFLKSILEVKKVVSLENEGLELKVTL